MVEKIVEIALLFDFYGQLLTDKQADIMDMHYNNDLSLSEISEQLGISRQGVYDSIKRAEKTLHDYEEKLGLVNRFIKQTDNLQQINLMLDALLEQNDQNVNSIKNKAMKIKEFIEKLI